MRKIGRREFISGTAAMAASFALASCGGPSPEPVRDASNLEMRSKVMGLLGSMKGKGGLERQRPLRELAGLGDPAVPDILIALRGDDRELRECAIWSISEMAEMNGIDVHLILAAPDLVKAMADPDWRVREGAAWALESIARKEYNDSLRDSEPALIKLLDDSDENVRNAGAHALRVLGTEAAVPALLGCLKDDAVWEKASEALLAIGMPAIPHIADAIEDPEVRKRAASILGDAGYDAVGVLVDNLKHRDPGVRKASAWALGKIGKPAQEAVGDLERLASEDPDDDVRKMATIAINAIPQEE